MKQTFVKCSLNILETFLLDYWNYLKDRHFLLSNHTLLTQKQLFHQELFKKRFPLKSSLNVPWMLQTTLREHSANISEILRAGWERVQALYCSFQVQFSSSHPNCSHFPISLKIYFCHDSEYPLCFVSFIMVYENHFPYFNLWFSLVVL